MPLADASRRMFLGRVSRSLLAIIFWILLAIWASSIIWLSSLSPDDLPPAAFLAWDKFNHFLAFAAGGWLAASALLLTFRDPSFVWKISIAIVVVALFGAADEMHQLITPGRSGADIYDWIADLIGAIAGASFSLLTHVHIERLFTRR